MGRPRKHPQLTYDEMVADMEVNGKHPKEYATPAGKARAESLVTDIALARAALQGTIEGGAANLSNPEEVKERTEMYFQACQATESYPSFIGLAVKAYGVTPQDLYKYVAKHPDTESVRIIEAARQMISDIIINQSLQGNAQPVASIFQLKNWYDHKDKAEVIVSTPEVDQAQADEIRRKYSDPEIVAYN